MVTEEGTAQAETTTPETEVNSQEQEADSKETTTETTTETTETKAEPYRIFNTPEEFRSVVDKEKEHLNTLHMKDGETLKEVIAQRNDLKKQLREATRNNELKALFEADIDDGTDEDKAKHRDSLRKKFTESLNEYEANVEEVNDTIEVLNTIKENMNKELYEKHGLNDPNPYARALNIANLINENIGKSELNEIYGDIIEYRFAKGTDLRKELDDLATELQGLSPDARKLRLEKFGEELEITPRKAPPKKETEKSGGGLTHEIIRNMSPAEKERRNKEIIKYYDDNPL